MKSQVEPRCLMSFHLHQSQIKSADFCAIQINQSSTWWCRLLAKLILAPNMVSSASSLSAKLFDHSVVFCWSTLSHGLVSEKFGLFSWLQYLWLFWILHLLIFCGVCLTHRNLLVWIKQAGSAADWEPARARQHVPTDIFTWPSVHCLQTSRSSYSSVSVFTAAVGAS